MPKSRSSLTNHVSSVTIFRRALYLISVEDNETVGCFLDFQEMGLPPKEMKKSVTECREDRQVAQSESE